MKQNPLTLPLIGGCISLICFLLPWIKYDMSALGLDPNYSNLHGRATVSGFNYLISGKLFETLTFFAILTILGVSIYMLKQNTPWKSRIPVLICSAYGLVYVSIVIVLFIITDIRMGMTKFEFAPSNADIEDFISIGIGIYGVLIGFALAFIGAWKLPKENAVINENQ